MKQFEFMSVPMSSADLSLHGLTGWALKAVHDGIAFLEREIEPAQPLTEPVPVAAAPDPQPAPPAPEAAPPVAEAAPESPAEPDAAPEAVVEPAPTAEPQ